MLSCFECINQFVNNNWEPNEKTCETDDKERRDDGKEFNINTGPFHPYCAERG